MSAKAYFWAREYGKQKRLKSGPYSVLKELADCHNQNTGRCDPSVDHISDYTGLNRKTVMKGIEALTEMGAIIPVKKWGRRTSYSFNFSSFIASTDTKLGTGTENGTPDHIDSTEDGHEGLETDTENGTGTESGTGTKNDTGLVPKTEPVPVPKTVPEPESKPIKNLKETHRKISLVEIPEVFSREVVCEYIDHRSNLKKPLTEQSLLRILEQFQKVEDHPNIDLTPDDAVKHAIDSGWQGFNIKWIEPKAETPYATTSKATQQHNNDDTSWLDEDTINQAASLYESQGIGGTSCEDQPDPR